MKCFFYWMVMLWFASSLLGATYYVAPSGSNSNPGSQAQPWLTLVYSTAHISAGDTVRVQAGTYTESPTVITSGTAGSPTTYVADGLVTLDGEFTIHANYIRLIGFTVDRAFAANSVCVDLYNANQFEVWDCTLKGYGKTAIFWDTSNGTNADNGLVIGNTLTDTTNSTASAGMQVFGNGNLIGYNTWSPVHTDVINYSGNTNLFLNNYSFNGNTNQQVGHPDFIQTGVGTFGNSYTLFEANFNDDCTSPVNDNHHLSHLNDSGSTMYGYFLSRRNVSFNDGSGGHAFGGQWTNMYALHDEYVYDYKSAANATTSYGIYIQATLTNGAVINTMFVNAWGSSVVAPTVLNITAGSQNIVHDYNLAWDLGNPTPTWSAPFTSETHRVTGNPLFTDFANTNFWIQGGSAAIHAGGPVTTVTSGNGSGTSFTVGDAGFFVGSYSNNLPMYSGNLVPGDTITVGSTVAQVASVDYVNNTITVTASISWTNGAPVYWGSSSTPDIGAYPGNASRLTAAGLVKSGNTYTVLPNGDTRWVVFYVNGIPNTVVNSAPFTATITSGTVTAKAYARYAQQIPVIASTATPTQARVHP